jgi:hypothetical protein
MKTAAVGKPSAAQKGKSALLRQQYLIPRRSIEKVRALGRKAGVPATEIVRRAIEAYDPERLALSSEQDEIQARALLDEIHASLRETIARVDESLAVYGAKLARLEDGSVRNQVRTQTLEWLERNQQAAARLQELFAQQSASA